MTRGTAPGVCAAAALLVAATLGAQTPRTTSTSNRASGSAQSAAPQTLTPGARAYAIQGARIVTLAGAPIERGTIVVENGRIKAVGANVTVPAGIEVLKADGLEVYPGLFDSVSELGLTEIGSINATNDITELGAYNPQLVSATAIHPPSEHIPVARANGITHALSVPGLTSRLLGDGPVMGGQASAIHLNGWTVEEMLIRRSVVLSVNWPELMPAGRGGGGGFAAQRRQRSFTEAKQEYERKIRELEEWIERARRYQQVTEKAPGTRIDRDLKLEALAPVIKGELPLLVNANAERDIKNAIEFADKHGLKLIIAGGADAYRVTDLLAKKNVPVILGPVQALPSREDEPYDIRNTTPGALAKAGVKFALATFNSSDSRTLPYEIGNAVSYGLAKDEALKAITLYPAQILGLADQLGSLEPGKVANLIVTNGDPLEIRTEVRYVFINGQPTSLENKHRQSYEKYRARPRTAAPPTATK
jgi:imidazolonepropionase-like amidohydrolase